MFNNPIATRKSVSRAPTGARLIRTQPAAPEVDVTVATDLPERRAPVPAVPHPAEVNSEGQRTAVVVVVVVVVVVAVCARILRLSSSGSRLRGGMVRVPPNVIEGGRDKLVCSIALENAKQWMGRP